MKITRQKIRRLVRDIVLHYPTKSVDTIAGKHKLTVKYLGAGINRKGYLIVGTDVVLKVSENSKQSAKELKNIARFRKIKKLRKYLPKVYRYATCVSPNDDTSVVAMHYYPEGASSDECCKVEMMFSSLDDVHWGNVRKSRGGAIKLIDLGI